jgi:hypothetical protein
MIDEDILNMTQIAKEDEFLCFERIKKLPKTDVYSVDSKCSNISLGLIKWHPSWRHYCFFPAMDEETVHSDRCLLSISQFLTELNERHKKFVKDKSMDGISVPSEQKEKD